LKLTIHFKSVLREELPQDLLLQSGCYILYTKQFQTGIHRLNGVDTQGILYIGKADIIERRVNSLLSSIKFNSDINELTPKVKGHKSLSRKYHRIRGLIKTDFLYVDIFPVSNSLNPHVLESFFIEKYVFKYAELPPLNGNYGSFALYEAEQILREHNIDPFTFDFP